MKIFAVERGFGGLRKITPFYTLWIIQLRHCFSCRHLGARWAKWGWMIIMVWGSWWRFCDKGEFFSMTFPWDKLSRMGERQKAYICIIFFNVILTLVDFFGSFLIPLQDLSMDTSNTQKVNDFDLHARLLRVKFPLGGRGRLTRKYGFGILYDNSLPDRHQTRVIQSLIAL